MSEYMKAYNIAKATIHEPDEAFLSALSNDESEIRDKLISSDFEPEKDLLKMVSVLVSTGKNKNDDVFLAEELIRARASGKSKPLNVEHNSDHIIGHMTRSFVTTKGGEELSDEDLDKNPPQDFDITNEAVIYALVKPDEAKTIRALAAAGKLFVSVEMWFTDYHYLVGNKIIARNEQTSFLDKYLRVNGGEGVYQQEPVGRVLRNTLIGGIGVVEKPANSESIIKSVSSLLSESACDVEVYSDPIIKDNIVGDLSHKSLGSKQDMEDTEMKKLFEEMAETVKATTEAAVKKALEEKETDKSVETEEEVVTAATEDSSDDSPDNEQIAALTASIEDLKNQNTELAKAQKELTEKLDAIKLDELVAERKQALVSAGLNDEDAEKRVAKAASMTEAEFKEYLDEICDLFNSYLLGTASEDNKTDEGGESDCDDSETETAEAAEETEAAEDTEETKEEEDKAESSDETDAEAKSEEGTEADTDSAEATEADDDDAVIDMDKLENEDADIGLGEAEASGETLEEKLTNVLARKLAQRNNRWGKLLPKDED